MSTNHRHQTGRTGRRVAGVILAILLGPLATTAFAGPADAAASTPSVIAGPSSHWHCRVLPILC